MEGADSDTPKTVVWSTSPGLIREIAHLNGVQKVSEMIDAGTTSRDLHEKRPARDTRIQQPVMGTLVSFRKRHSLQPFCSPIVPLTGQWLCYTR